MNQIKIKIKGYILFDLKTKETFISRNVIFYEDVFPFSKGSQSCDGDVSSQSLPVTTFSDLDQFLNYHEPNVNPNLPAPHQNGPNNPQDHSNQPSPLPNLDVVPDSPPHLPVPHLHVPDPNQLVLRRSERNHQPPSYLKDYHCNLALKGATAASITSNVRYPLSQSLSYEKLSPSHKNYTLAISINSEPKTYAEAVVDECWRKAMQAELLALEKTKTWRLMVLPENKKAIGCKWVFKVRHKADGSIERYKARLVAKGYTQTEGIDYLETFSPVVKMTTIRVLLALASKFNWHLHQLDVNTAFLHGDLYEEVYMEPPPGLTVAPNVVCKLEKSLYGLKQASTQWNAKLTAVLLSCGYTQSKADHSLFTKSSGQDFTAVLVYVDDLVLAGTSLTEINSLKHVLDDKFSIKDLGVLKYFLGMEVARSSKGINLCQRKYALDLLSSAGLLASKSVSTPMDSTIKLHSASGPIYHDITSYRRMIGKLVYLTHTRPDLSYAVSHLSQFLDKPTIAHYNAAIRVLKYLKNEPGKGVFFLASSSDKVQGFSDSDWASCIDTR
ncbi:reverse transcriptase domain-containing protein, partial [Candidatus Phytoplasma australasiaticum]|uniref:reverse transcriptase domain-containing protein n=1 Tax=Candidatus Phytoplasma australasiaticum TaxID=2754999 RepID=UPI00271299ED